jgi:hypothetical protein
MCFEEVFHSGNSVDSALRAVLERQRPDGFAEIVKAELGKMPPEAVVGAGPLCSDIVKMLALRNDDEDAFYRRLAKQLTEGSLFADDMMRRAALLQLMCNPVLPYVKAAISPVSEEEARSLFVRNGDAVRKLRGLHARVFLSAEDEAAAFLGYIESFEDASLRTILMAVLIDCLRSDLAKGNSESIKACG